MTNESSSPALIPGTLPEGLLPPMICGKSTQEVYQDILAVTGVEIAAGQRGPQGNPGPPGPAATLAYSDSEVTMGTGTQNVVVTLASGEPPSHYLWFLKDPTDSATPLSPAPAIAYFSLTASSNQWRVTLTAPVPNDGWVLTRTRLTTTTT